MKKTLYILPPLIIILLVLAWLLLPADRATNQAGSPKPEKDISWQWENPYTGRKVTIPGQWREARGEQLKDTLLALTHETGKSIVYIIYETSADSMSLQEYVNVMKDSNRTELGTEDFQARSDEDGQEFYLAKGGKYFGDSLVNTGVRIWSDRPDHFWRLVSMTDSDYRELGFDAEHVLELLIQSTK